ncbi:MAG: hypothetical protein PHS30_04780 [Bacteroidales bacterium]|nr:hypothetical protein [Bacteroidales bacterium]
MKSIVRVFLLAFFVFATFLTGCSQEDAFGDDPMGALRFSADTLSFGTVFSTLGTTTAWIKVYNTADEKIRISGIRLKSGGNSGFRINVDGVSDYSFTDVDIPAKDSLFIFVALTAPERGSSTPLPVRDAILFQSDNGQKQIVVEAFSQDAVIWRGKTITSDTTLTAGQPFIIYDSLVVARNVTLQVAQGVTLHLHAQSKVIVHGTIKVAGTAVAPVTFRGDRLDDILLGFPYDYFPGQWGSICLTGSSYDNEFDYVHIRGACSGLIADSSALDRCKLKINHSVIHNMVDYCLISNHSKLSVINSQLSNSGGSTVCLNGGETDFIHCTITNYQHLISRNGPTLKLVNPDDSAPMKADFVNCIVYGNQMSEIGFTNINEARNVWDLLFRNCLLRSDKEGLSTYTTCTDCLFSKNPLFLKLGSTSENDQYDFRLDSLSSARHMADLTYSQKYPYDMNGIYRLGGSGSDIGAYQWSPLY